jgi:hypothetical protein
MLHYILPHVLPCILAIHCPYIASVYPYIMTTFQLIYVSIYDYHIPYVPQLILKDQRTLLLLKVDVPISLKEYLALSYLHMYGIHKKSNYNTELSIHALDQVHCWGTYFRPGIGHYENFTPLNFGPLLFSKQ